MATSAELILRRANRVLQLVKANTAMSDLLDAQIEAYELENGISGQRQKAINIKIDKLQTLINNLESEIDKIDNQINNSPMTMNIRVRRRR